VKHISIRIMLAAVCAVAMTGVWSATADAPVPSCFGKRATIVGTEGADSLRGSDLVSDVIYGGGGNDYISGGDFYGSNDHPDLICGGPGTDRMTGSAAGDRLRGGDGDDWIYGDLGEDLLLGDDGDDRLVEESIADSDRVDDILRGGTGSDRLRGGWGSDRLFGGAGEDTLIDAECDGPTLLNGGGGSDYLESWSSSFEGWHGSLCGGTSDRVFGAGGTDTAEVDLADWVGAVEHITRVTEAVDD
jgi:Ca2+-binding RTX toxin-like protein